MVTHLYELKVLLFRLDTIINFWTNHFIGPPFILEAIFLWSLSYVFKTKKPTP